MQLVAEFLYGHTIDYHEHRLGGGHGHDTLAKQQRAPDTVEFAARIVHRGRVEAMVPWSTVQGLGVQMGQEDHGTAAAGPSDPSPQAGIILFLGVNSQTSPVVTEDTTRTASIDPSPALAYAPPQVHPYPPHSFIVDLVTRCPLGQSIEMTRDAVIHALLDADNRESMDTRTGEGCRFAFIVRWLDPKTLLIWHYQLFYYTYDQSVEMFDIKNQRIFLKRVSHPEIHLEHLYIGASISLYSRQLIIESYGDEFTKKHLQGFQETTFALIKPDGLKNMGRIIDMIFANGFLIKELKMCKLSLEDAQNFYKANAEKPFFEALTQFMASGLCVAMDLVAENAVRRWRTLLGN
ncbi:hypothetical protein L7F22_049863 [Adiantum nelumboides]|nr:hypothetical protein [Adiantum nelumboides]